MAVNVFILRNLATYFLLIALACVPLCCEAGQPHPNNDREEANRLYSSGYMELKKGKHLERAIKLLERAVALDPSNSDFKLMLGATYAARFASVAIGFRQVTRYDESLNRHMTLLREWESAQSQRGHPLFRSSRPLPPPLPTTIDDGKPMIGDIDSIKSNLKRLAESSIKRLAESCDHARNDSPEVLARSHYVRGWALALLWRCGKGIIPEEPSIAHATGVRSTSKWAYSSREYISADFRRAMELDESIPAYSHSLGVSYVFGILDPIRDGLFSDNTASLHPTDRSQIPESLKLLKNVAREAPRNRDLLYQLALIASFKDPAESALYLEKAVTHSGTNAIAWYLLALQQFEKANQQEGAESAKTIGKALDSVARGNNARAYIPIVIRLPVPPELRAVWDYEPLVGYGEDILVLMKLGDAIASVVKTRIERLEEQDALVGIQVLMGMGLRAIGGYDAGVTSTSLRGSVLIPRRLKWGVIYSMEAYTLAGKLTAKMPTDRNMGMLREYMELTEKFLRPLNEFTLRVL